MWRAVLLAVVTIALLTAGLQVAASGDSSQAENATNHDSTGTWQTVLMADGKECKGMVFESAEAAQQKALKIGCSGYHEHLKDDGTVAYMPCANRDQLKEKFKVRSPVKH